MVGEFERQMVHMGSADILAAGKVAHQIDAVSNHAAMSALMKAGIIVRVRASSGTTAG